MFKVVFGIYRSVSQHRDKDTAIAEINSGFRSAREAKLSRQARIAVTFAEFPGCPGDAT